MDRFEQEAINTRKGLSYRATLIIIPHDGEEPVQVYVDCENTVINPGQELIGQTRVREQTATAFDKRRESRNARR